MSDQVLAREIIARPPARHAVCARRQLGLAGAALLIGVGAAWYGYHGRPSGASSRARTMPMSAARSR